MASDSVMETPEAFAERLAREERATEDTCSREPAAALIRARDAAIRAEALREAAHLLRDAAQIAAAVCGQSDTAGYRMAMANAEAIIDLADTAEKP